MAGYWILAIAFVCLVLGVAAWTLVRLASAASVKLPGPEWMARFDPTRFTPVLRLLDGGDLRFISSQPGYTPEIGACFRANRRRILSGYLNWMKLDFDRLYIAGKAYAASASEDRSALVMRLLRLRGAFLLAYAGVQVRLLLGLDDFSQVRVLLETISQVRLLSGPAQLAPSAV